MQDTIESTHSLLSILIFSRRNIPAVTFILPSFVASILEVKKKKSRKRYKATRHIPQLYPSSTLMVSQMWPGRHLLLLVTLYTTIPKTVRAQTCYLPNGSVAYGDTPCSTGGGNTTCCAGACLANGLCFNPNVNLLSRSSCTDSTWTASECTSVCKTGMFPILYLTATSNLGEAKCKQ